MSSYATLVRTLIVGFLFVATTACGEENRTEVEFTPSNEKNILSSDDASPALSEVSNTGSTKFSGGGTGAAQALLTSTPGNTVSAELSMRSIGGTGAATVRLSGGSVGQTYGGLVRRGTCEQPGGMVASLVPITADSLGAGSSYSDVMVSVDQLTSQPHIATYGLGARTESCGSFAAAP